MIIQDILEDLINPSVQRKNFKGNFTSGDDSSRTSGAYSTTNQDKKDPHMVVKHHHSPLSKESEDGYNYFIQSIIKNKLSGYVNFPRVYNTTKIEDSEGKMVFKYNLEKLISFREVSMSELVSVVKRSVDVGSYALPTEESDNSKRDLVRALGTILEKAITFKDFSHIKDGELHKALSAMVDMAANPSADVFLDLTNSGNIMFRRGKFGLQIVLIDPFA